MAQIRKLLFLLLFFSLSTIFAQSVQNGVVIEHNSNGKRLANVTLKVQGAPATISDQNGNFRLQFSYSHAGDRILVEEISKSGYEIVNNRDLENWILSPKTTFVIYLAKKGDIDQARMNYYHIGEQSIRKIYGQSVDKLNEQLDNQLITIENYKKELQEAYDNRNLALKQLEVLSDKFARINLDDIDSLNLTALRLFEQGKLMEVIALYEKEQTRDRLLQKSAQQQEIKEDMKHLVEVLLTENDYRKLLGGKQQYEEIERNLQSILQADSTDLENLTRYAVFLYETGNYEQAIALAQQALPLVTDSTYIISLNHIIGSGYQLLRQYSKAEAPLRTAIAYIEGSHRAQDISLLSTLYKDLCGVLLELARKSEAEEYLKLSTSVLQKEMSNQPEYYYDLARNWQFLGYFHEENADYSKALEAYVMADSLYRLSEKKMNLQANINHCVTLNQIGSIYKKMNDFDNAHHYLTKAYRLNNELAKDSLMVFLESKAFCSNSLGTFYNDINWAEEAIPYLLEAADIYEKLSGDWMADLLSIYSNVGLSYKKLGQFDTAYIYYQKALQIAEQAYQVLQDQAALEDIAFVEVNYGMALSDGRRCEEAAVHLQKAVDLYRKMDDQHSMVHQYYLATALNNSGTNYLDMNEPKMALKMLNEAISIYKKLSAESPETFLPLLAHIYNNIGYYYGTQGNYAKAARYILQACNYLEEIAQQNSDYENRELLLAKNNVAYLYNKSGDLKKSLDIFTETIAKARIAVTKFGNSYQIVLANILENAGNLYVDLKMTEEAKAAYRESVDIYSVFAQQTPERFQPMIDRMNEKLKKL